MLWDIFCRVIDNLGDIGVCWRLSADLAARGHTVRLWADDSSALQWMAPGAQQGEWPGVRVLDWDQATRSDTLLTLSQADVWVESFGCDLPEPFVQHFAQAPSSPLQAHPAWINLEYLSAEAYVKRCHGLPSPVLQGPAKGWTKHFYYPGFTQLTGGLLREPGVAQRDQNAAERSAFLSGLGIHAGAEMLVSLFCYEPPLLQALLRHWAAAPHPTRLLVTSGRAQKAVQALLPALGSPGQLAVTWLPLLSQSAFDALLQSCDLNFVRGEDSVVRAIWAGKPFVWHIYPQDDGADAPKLEAFLQQMQFSAPVRALHRAWNGHADATDTAQTLAVLQPEAHAQWQAQVQAARAQLLKMDDLTTQLLQFVQKNR